MSDVLAWSANADPRCDCRINRATGLQGSPHGSAFYAR